MSGVVASIGATHPWNAAGLGLDMHVANSFGVRNLTVVIAVTAQDTKGIRALEAVSVKTVRAQLAVLPVEEIDVLRIGALAGEDNVSAVADFVHNHPAILTVVDPVFGATLGGSFLDERAYEVFQKTLATLPSVILTPNLAEGARLLGLKQIAHSNLAEAAKELCERGVQAVVLKGGHLQGNPIDAFARREGEKSTVELFEDERLPQQMRGTGCILAMALACELARKLSLRDAVQSARAFVRSRIVAAEPFAGLNLAY